MTLIVAFGHRRFVGKDTIGRMLATEHNGNNDRFSFAKPMKDHSYKLFKRWGLKSYEYYEQNPLEKETIIPALNKSARDIWIAYGNWMREIHQDVWAAATIDQCLQSQVSLAIITDLRYRNEFEMVRDSGGIVVRVDRASAPRHNDVADSALGDYNNWDFVITNDGDDKCTLQQTVKDFYQWLQLMRPFS